MNKTDTCFQNGTPDPPQWVSREATRLLASKPVTPAAWRRQWAALAERAGWPCYGMTWRQWAELR